MRPLQALKLFALPFLALPLAPTASAQGKFVNFEDPLIAPITIADVGNIAHVVVCNAADNSLEIYDGNLVFDQGEWQPPGAPQRVPVGISPVTVRWNPTNQKL